MTAKLPIKCPTCGGPRRRKDGIITIGQITLDPLTGAVAGCDQLLRLSKRQSQLLAFLMSYSGRPIPREKIRESVWPKSKRRSNVVDVYINYLRNKGLKAFITTVRGKGYMFSGEAPQ